MGTCFGHSGCYDRERLFRVHVKSNFVDDIGPGIYEHLRCVNVELNSRYKIGRFAFLHIKRYRYQ